MKPAVYLALILALAAAPAHANSERKRNAPRPDYDAYKKELALEMALIPEGEVEIGQPVDVLVKLVNKRTGRALPVSAFLAQDTALFQLYLLDPSLTDLQVVTPAPTETEGLYRFTFTPRKPGGYRGWADIRAAKTGNQQFVMADVSPIRGQGMNKTNQLEISRGGFNFSIDRHEPLKANRKEVIALQIHSADGGHRLQLAQMQASMVGIFDDFRTAVELKPLKPEGEESLRFELKPEQPGFLRLFLQTQVNGTSLLVPFGLTVTGKKRSDEKIFHYDSLF